MEHKKLLVIDPSGVSPDLNHYFDKFNFCLEEQRVLSDLSMLAQNADVILIHQSFLDCSSVISDFVAHTDTALIVIDDFFDESNCIKWLESGADDYVVKPINPRELHARINGILRRFDARKTAQEHDIFIFDNWTLYTGSRYLVDTCLNEVQLSIGEFNTLMIFVQNPLKTLDREFLLKSTTNEEFNPLDRRVDVQVSRLRHKIEPDVAKPTLIKTIRNGGYVFTAKVLRKTTKL